VDLGVRVAELVVVRVIARRKKKEKVNAREVDENER